MALPQPGLMELCTDPELIIPSSTVKRVAENGLSWKKSQKDCKARMQCLVWWLLEAKGGHVAATCEELEELHGTKEKNP